MTKGSTREECEEVLSDILLSYKGQPWFIKAFIESDDHGLCVGVRVKREVQDRPQLLRVINGVKVITYLVG